jgi:transcriptional regulator with XRE-family HTH domain
MEVMSFGELLRNKRVEIGMTLREFARLTSYDASNLSKIERDITLPPSTITLRAWAQHLKMGLNTTECQEFLDIAQLSRNRIPDDVSPQFRNQLLPALLRTSRSKHLTKEEFDRLIKLLNK